MSAAYGAGDNTHVRYLVTDMISTKIDDWLTIVSLRYGCTVFEETITALCSTMTSPRGR